MDPRAFSLGRAVCTALEQCDIDFQCAKIGSSEDLRFDDIDVVLMAAMVGETAAAKQQLLAWLAKRVRKGTLVLVRSASGLKTVLYPVCLLASSLWSNADLSQEARLRNRNPGPDAAGQCFPQKPYYQ